jgi:hypothetical protein
MPVLANVANAEFGELTDERCRMEFGHDNRGQLVRVPAGVVRSIRYGGPHSIQPV